jgi:RNA polymerase sigma-70 factor, ECF subfamily
LENRNHFYAIAAQCMRRVLLDYPKARAREKRGGNDAKRVTFSDVALISPVQSNDLIALDAALKRLAAEDDHKNRMVELRYFGGYSIEEVSAILNLSEAAVARDWRLARAWLHREVSGN